MLVMLKETKLNLGSGVITGGGIIGGVGVELASGGNPILVNCCGTTSSEIDEMEFVLNEDMEADGVDTIEVNTAAAAAAATAAAVTYK